MKFLTYILALPLALATPVIQSRDGASPIPERWIAVLNDDVHSTQLESVLDKVTSHLQGTKPDTVWDFDGFKGFSFGAKDGLIKTLTSAVSELAFIEQDAAVHTQETVTQKDPVYNLARISHRDIDNSTYIYDSSAGEGVVAYGIDTGIYTEHSEFEGRATMGKSFVKGQSSDGNGHGTHTAATIGGVTYGVAKKVTLVGVKVLDNGGSGATSDIVSGIEWAVKDMKSRGKVRKAVANMSLGGLRTSNANNAAVKAATEAGLFFSVAAGNSALPAELYSPASEPSACTVAASDGQDNFASFSNYGAVVDIIAPGVDVKSAFIGNPDKTEVLSGTSMAAPHIAGLGAYLLALEGQHKPEDLCSRMTKLSTQGKVSGLGALLTPNDLAFNGAKA